MTLEQPTDLNRYVDDTIPMNWDVRRRMIFPLLPLILVTCLFTVESLLFRLWLDDQDLVAKLPLLGLAAFLPIAGVFILAEVLTRTSQWTKRVLKLEDRRITISPAKFGMVPWDRSVAWCLEPVKENQRIRKLTLDYVLDKKARIRRRWLMVLEHPSQTVAFKSELDTFRKRGKSNAALVELPEPTPKQTPKPIRGIWPLAVAVYLFVHGLPMLGIGLSMSDNTSDPDRRPVHFSNHQAKLLRTLHHFFQDGRELRRFLIIAGSGTTALATVFYVFGLRSRFAAITGRMQSCGHGPAG